MLDEFCGTSCLNCNHDDIIMMALIRWTRPSVRVRSVVITMATRVVARVRTEGSGYG